MSNDLISRSALMEALLKYEEEVEECMSVPSFAGAIHVIRQQPVAYDVDQIVEQITEAQKDPNLYVYAWDAYQKAIEIVRGAE